MICVINSRVANISSVMFALERLGVQATLSCRSEDIRAADHVLFPGVGHAAAAMQYLKQVDLIEVIQGLTQPVLGICVGMQLLFEHSSEGEVDTLGLIPGTVQRLTGKDLIIPHMGWNQLNIQRQHPLLEGINEGDYCYFVHSYAAPISQFTLAACDYGQAFTAVVNKDNFYGCQFHTERSGKVGLQLLRNFLKL